jgi:hypothetical protein
MDLQDRARFYGWLVELLIERRDGVQQALEATEPEPDFPQQVH